MLKINGLTKIYGLSDVKAVDDLSLEVESGEIFGFIGPRGKIHNHKMRHRDYGLQRGHDRGERLRRQEKSHRGKAQYRLRFGQPRCLRPTHGGGIR